MHLLESRLGIRILLAVSAGALIAGGIAWLADAHDAADAIWIAGTLAVLVPTVIDATAQVLRRQPGVDLIAILAMAGSIAYGEYVAGIIIALMLATGSALEAYAAGRAQRDLTALLERAPRTAHRIEGGEIITVDADDVRRGDRLLVREADLVPVDGMVVDSVAVLDESVLTGESRLVTREAGDFVSSGTVNAGSPFQVIAAAPAAESAYAGVVRLVEEARQSKAPFTRLADRYALFFIPVTLIVAGLAWALSGDPVRALAVLVVATPCPLLLGAPIAIVAGLSRAARQGVIVKGGAALEALAGAETVLVDKTGTLTLGQSRVQRLVTARGWHDEDALLRLAASLEQASSHVVAAALVREARQRSLGLALPGETSETAGEGMEGDVEGRHVVVGRPGWVFERMGTAEDAVLRRRVQRHSGSSVAVAVDGAVAGVILLDDPVRADTPRTLRALKRTQVRDVVMLTGDHASVAHAIGAALGIDRVLAERSPEEKLLAVQESRERGVTVMVGDGINDAPALAAADVGVAMGARGATSSSEAADVVLVRDRLDGLVIAIRIAGRSRRIALESVFVGMGLSFVAMGFAAFGYLPPVAGALLQEGIDIVAIAIALRALRAEREERRGPLISDALAERLRAEHEELLPQLARFRAVADHLPELEPRAARAELDAVVTFYRDTIVPHEQADETEIYPVLRSAIEHDAVLDALARSHAEIFHLGRQLESLQEGLLDDGVMREDLPDLQRVLYALHAVLELHFAQEAELYAALNEQYLEPPMRASTSASTTSPS